MKLKRTVEKILTIITFIELVILGSLADIIDFKGFIQISIILISFCFNVVVLLRYGNGSEEQCEE